MGPPSSAVLPLMAIIVLVLMGAAAMAVDLGWLYWQSLEVQDGADAAALAGVVYEPDLRTEAHTEAVAAAAENGFDDASASTTVTVIDLIDDDAAVVNDSMLRVTIEHEVGTFFMKPLGLDSVTVARSTVAEYVQPLPMGSPESRLHQRKPDQADRMIDDQTGPIRTWEPVSGNRSLSSRSSDPRKPRSAVKLALSTTDRIITTTVGSHR